MAVNFYLDKRTDKRGDAPIRVSVSIGGARYVTSSGHKIAPSKWDNAKQQVRRGCSNASGATYNVINSALAKMADHFAEWQNECLRIGKAVTSADIKEEFGRNFGRKSYIESKAASLFDYLDEFMEEQGTACQWTEATYKKFTTLKHHIAQHRRDATFDYFDERGLNAFVTFLKDEKQMRNSTISKAVSYIKWFLRWATRKGYNTNTKYIEYSPKLKNAPKKVIFLTWEELMRVYHYDIPDNGTVVRLTDMHGNGYDKIVSDAPAIRKTRDIFCFCCFTSLRYSDATNLKRSDINTADNTMTITTVKTADTITIELNKYALAILDRYAGLKDYALPHITNQRMNIYLKDLCELCGINQPITQTFYRGSERCDETVPKYELIGTHAGRRTFICNALMLGISAEIVMKWTGHSTYAAMKPYIDVTNAAKAEAMAKFNEI